MLKGGPTFCEIYLQALDWILTIKTGKKFKAMIIFPQNFAPNSTLLNYLMFSKVETISLFRDVFRSYELVNKQGILNISHKVASH